MIIWTGLGLIVPIIAFAVLVCTQLAVDACMGDGYYTANGWPKPVAWSLAAAAVWYVGRRMNKPIGRVFIDKETGEEFQQHVNHSLFFIPVQYWAYVILGFAVYMLIDV